jgi:hypothetical protein
MFRRRIRSALFIDRENIALPADSITNWLAWLEDGEFDAGRRRRFLIKRIYWNSSNERHRDQYVRAGFDVVVCERFAGLTNSADIRMAIDIVESARDRPRIREYILVTADSDFVPVLQRLDEKGKRTAFVVNEAQPNVHTTYRQHADILIPRRLLNEASRYIRPKRGLMALFGAEGKAPAAVDAAHPKPEKKPRAPGHEAGLAMALDRLIKVASLQPGKFTAQKRIVQSWSGIQGFRTQGKEAYLGTGSYKALVKLLAQRDPRVKIVDQKGDGTAVMYVPAPDARGSHEGQASPVNKIV